MSSAQNTDHQIPQSGSRIQSLEDSVEKPYSLEGLSNTSNKAIRFLWLQLQPTPENFIYKQPLLNKKEMQT